MVSCDASGQYLQIRIAQAGSKLEFSDVLAFDEAPIVISSSTDISLQDISEHDSNSLFRVFENFDPSLTGCGTFTTTSDAPHFEITLPSLTRVTSIMVHGNSQSADGVY